MTTTNIRIDLNTKDRLTKLMVYGDSYSTIIAMLLYEHDLLEAINKSHPDIVKRKPHKR